MLELNAQKRDASVKPHAIREEGMIPAVFYSGKQETTPITVSASDFKKVYKEAGESGVVTLTVDGTPVSVLVHEVAYHPVSDEPIHVDFYVIEADKPVEVEVPLVFTGVAPAEKLGGVVVKVMHEVEVKGLPKDLPHEITIDLSGLTTLDAHITVADLALPAGITATANPEDVVVSVGGASSEEDTSAEAPDLSAVEVAKKGKKEEEE